MPKKHRKDKDRRTGEEAAMASGSASQRAERKNSKKRPQPSESHDRDTDDSRGSNETDPESEDDSKKAKKQKKQKKEKRSKKDKKDKKDKKEKKLKKEHTSSVNNNASQSAATNISLPTPPPTSSASSSIQSPKLSPIVSTPLVAAVGSMTVAPSLPQTTIKAPAMLPRTVLASRMVPRQISRPTPGSSTSRPGTSVPPSQPGSIPKVFRAKDIIAHHQSHMDLTPSSTSTSTAPFTSTEISTPAIMSAMLKQAEPIVHFPAGDKKQGKHGEFLYGNYPHYYVKRASEQKRGRAKREDDEQGEEDESERQGNNKNTTSKTTRRRIYRQEKIAVKTATTPSVLLPCTGYEHTYTHQGQGTTTSVQELARKVDLRLEFLEPSWFYKKRVLDIGCNAALLTVFIALHYEPRKIQGVDIDPSLIHKAQQFVRNTFSQLSSEAYTQKKKEEATQSSSSSTSEHTSGPVVPYEAYFPKSMSYLHGLMPVPPKTQGTETLFPHNIEFRIADWMAPTGNTPSHVSEEDGAWDVIIGFSLTKWIHLHHGDKGLQEFFHKVYKALAPGGVFLVEPQAYNTYAKRSKITPIMRENYLAIKMKPEMFEEYLVKTVGFKESKLLGQSEGSATNFNRDIYMFRK